MKQLSRLCKVLSSVALSVVLSAAYGTVVWAQKVPVQLWVTTSNTTGVVLGLQRQHDLRFTADANDSITAIDVDEAKVFQKMEGGGASFTDSAAWLVNEKLSPASRKQVMRKLFDPKAGIGLSFLRNPMGASDLTRTEYTYDDDASDQADPALPHFSIAHDLVDILPLTKTARQINRSLQLMMVPWSPPAWMKDNNSLVHGDILPKFYPHLTNYFLKTMQAYEAQGIHIDYVALNNEPMCCPEINYPSANLPSEEQITILKDYWFPAWEKNHIQTRIFLLDFNWCKNDLVTPLLQESAIRTSPFVAGVAYHGYCGTPAVQTENHNAFEAEAFFTERTGSIKNSPDVQHSRDMKLMIGIFRNWGRTFVKWPIAADENQGPHLGGCATCTGLITVHTKDKPGKVDYGIEYYTMGHYTKFVPVGASLIDSTASDNVLNAAFKNPDSSLVLIAYNNTNQPQSFKVRWHSQVFHYTLPVNTSATFRWPGKP
ncbi:MAG TPA: glycoside hydrolase family 30 beta sandwich domain-containing protein [Terriglobales bacterium]|jgi:glucosylceramidase|nr:glycoside hydrolase family 30 beta sandwich domain-containing protein [Terriglobales bacterium]